MIDEIVKVLVGDNNYYRTVFPPSMAEEVKHAQATAWTMTV